MSKPYLIKTKITILLKRLLDGEISYEEYIAKKEKNEKRNEKRRKYKAGQQITSIDELLRQEFVMIHGKPYHIAWIKSWQLFFVIGQLEQGNIKYAIKK